MDAIRTTFRSTLTAFALVVATAAATPSPEPQAIVEIRDFDFAPPEIVVRAGEQVTFVNRDDEAHTVTADDKSFDSEGLDTGDRWRHVFGKPGTYHYYCELHPYMKGTVVVK